MCVYIYIYISSNMQTTFVSSSQRGPGGFMTNNQLRSWYQSLLRRLTFSKLETSSFIVLCESAETAYSANWWLRGRILKFLEPAHALALPLPVQSPTPLVCMLKEKEGARSNSDVHAVNKTPPLLPPSLPSPLSLPPALSLSQSLTPCIE